MQLYWRLYWRTEQITMTRVRMHHANSTHHSRTPVPVGVECLVITPSFLIPGSRQAACAITLSLYAATYKTNLFSAMCGWKGSTKPRSHTQTALIKTKDRLFLRKISTRDYFPITIGLACSYRNAGWCCTDIYIKWSLSLRAARSTEVYFRLVRPNAQITSMFTGKQREIARIEPVK